MLVFSKFLIPLFVVLLQEGASVIGDVKALESTSETVKQHWKLMKLEQPKHKLVNRASILYETACLDWQGIMYMMLDQLQLSSKDYFPAVEAALYARKYRLALSLVMDVTDSRKLTSVNDKGQSLLHILAIVSQPGSMASLQTQTATCLLNHGLSAEKRDIYRACPIVYAAINKNNDLFELFADKMGHDNVSKVTPDKLGRTPLNAMFWKTTDFAWTKPSEKSIRKWWDLYSESSNWTTLVNYPTPHPHPGNFELQHAEDPNAVVDKTWLTTQLIHAICCRSRELAAYLLSKGANANLPDNHGCTALMHAVRMNDCAMVKLLLNVSSCEVQTVGSMKNKESSSGMLTFRNELSTAKQKRALAAKKRRNEQEEEDEKEKVELDTDDIDDGCDLEELFQVIGEKPSVNVYQKDNKGRTVVHYVVEPFDGMSYENVELLKLLVTKYARMNEPDKEGITPLQMAVNGRFYKMAEAIKVVTNSNLRIPMTWSPRTEVEDCVDRSQFTWEFRRDAASFLELQEIQDEVKGVSKVFENIPDRRTDMTETGEVIMDTDLDIPYDILMRKVDITFGTIGRYSFYKMQLIKHKAKPLFLLFTSWGSFGTDGQYQLTPFNTFEEARKEFTNIFKAKSGNAWEVAKSFVLQPKKYHLVSFEERVRVERPDVTFTMNSNVKSKLPKILYDLMESLANVHAFHKAYTTDNMATDCLPFGRYSEETISGARVLINELRELLKEREEVQKKTDFREELCELLQTLITKTNQLYQLVPATCYFSASASRAVNYEKLNILDNTHNVEQLSVQLDALADLGIASQLLQAAEYRRQVMNPLDYIYYSLNLRMNLLNEMDKESQLILQYMHNTRGTTKPKVTGIYELARVDETANECKLGNRWLLWHGTRDVNLFSIFAKGLQCNFVNSPNWIRDKPSIYFADMFEKSEGFVSSSSMIKNSYILLCEVALGNVKPVTSFEVPPSGFDSLKICGSKFPDPSQRITLSSGVRIPLGKAVKRKPEGEWYDRYNEYVVFDQSQVKLRYLVQFENSDFRERRPSASASSPSSHETSKDTDEDNSVQEDDEGSDN